MQKKKKNRILKKLKHLGYFLVRLSNATCTYFCSTSLHLFPRFYFGPPCIAPWHFHFQLFFSASQTSPLSPIVSTSWLRKHFWILSSIFKSRGPLGLVHHNPRTWTQADLWKVSRMPWLQPLGMRWMRRDARRGEVLCQTKLSPRAQPRPALCISIPSDHQLIMAMEKVSCNGYKLHFYNAVYYKFNLKKK